MKCPYCLNNNRVKKKPDLKTLRTLANGNSVKRERVCPRCEKRCDTVELFVKEYDQERQAAVDELESKVRLMGMLKEQNEEVKDAIKVLLQVGRG
ncbi:MAG: hypothetical protein KAR83_04935 [Thermodesulfovibrionales bacterium]|nr:hypothetical protein [Thermodesulfovibrionales bacterium]